MKIVHFPKADTPARVLETFTLHISHESCTQQKNNWHKHILCTLKVKPEIMPPRSKQPSLMYINYILKVQMREALKVHHYAYTVHCTWTVPNFYQNFHIQKGTGSINNKADLWICEVLSILKEELGHFGGK